MTELVYFIGAAFDAAVKIGCSGDFKRRLAQIQLLSPEEVSVLHLVRTPAPYQMESHLHDVFADYRVRGEWFRIPDLSIDLIEHAVSSFEMPERRKQERDPYTAAAMVMARALIGHYRKERLITVAQAAAAVAAERGLSRQLLWKLMYRPFVSISAGDYAAIWFAAADLFPDFYAPNSLPTPSLLVGSEHLPSAFDEAEQVTIPAIGGQNNGRTAQA